MMEEKKFNVGDNVWIIPGFSEDALIAIKCCILDILDNEVVLDEPLGHTISISNLFNSKSEAKKELYSRWDSLREENKNSASASVNTTIRNFRNYYIEKLASFNNQDVEEYRQETWEGKLKYKRPKKEWFNIRDMKLERKAKGIMSDFHYKKLSKFIAFLLRHSPESGNLKLDNMGACKIDDLLKVVQQHMKFKVTKKNIERLARLSNDPREKQRYIIEGEYIRAGHGHSIEITDYKQVFPTEDLYHGTPSYIVDKIVQSSLSKMTRDKVHLSYDEAITLEAARRRSRNVTLLRINIEDAIQAGIMFYESADPRIILSEDIPSQFLEKLENEEWIRLVPEMTMI
jgi:putative RNA 2'-phosphotransferase